jgi:hypothetical protein
VKSKSRSEFGKQARRDYYQWKISSEKVWRNQAVELISAANILEPVLRERFKSRSSEFDKSPNQVPTAPFPDGMLSVYRMLMAYALENLLKAKWVKLNIRGKRGQILAVEELPKELHQHDLVKLAKNIRLNLTGEDEELLHRLTLDSTWAGRYPVPTKFQDLRPRCHSSSEIRSIKRLVGRMKRQLWRES